MRHAHRQPQHLSKRKEGAPSPVAPAAPALTSRRVTTLVEGADQTFKYTTLRPCECHAAGKFCSAFCNCILKGKCDNVPLFCECSKSASGGCKPGSCPCCLAGRPCSAACGCPTIRTGDSVLISGLEGELSALNGTLGVVDGPARASASNDGLASTMASVGQPGNRKGGGSKHFCPHIRCCICIRIRWQMANSCFRHGST